MLSDKLFSKIFFLFNNNIMVVKKKKTEDKKEIEKLKKKLKSLTAKYLKERKKRVKNPKEFKKIQDNIKSKVEQASSQQDISKLLTLLGAVKQNQPINEVSKGTIQSRLNREKLLKQRKETVECPNCKCKITLQSLYNHKKSKRCLYLKKKNLI